MPPAPMSARISYGPSRVPASSFMEGRFALLYCTPFPGHARFATFFLLFSARSELNAEFGETAPVTCNRRCCSLAKTQPTVIMQAHCRGYKPEPHDSTLKAGAP